MLIESFNDEVKVVQYITIDYKGTIYTGQVVKVDGFKIELSCADGRMTVDIRDCQLLKGWHSLDCKECKEVNTDGE